jgi:hypothetical protein
MKGKTPTVSQGMAGAGKHIGKLFVWALIAASVGTALRFVEQKTAGVGGKVAAWAFEVAWGLATYFIVPVLIFEDLRPWPSIKRSAWLFKESWGETFFGELSIAFFFSILALPAFIPVFLSLLIFHTLDGLYIGLGIAGVYLIIIVSIAAGASIILKASLYRYVQTGKKDIDLPDWAIPDKIAGTMVSE